MASQLSSNTVQTCMPFYIICPILHLSGQIHHTHFYSNHTIVLTISTYSWLSAAPSACQVLPHISIWLFPFRSLFRHHFIKQGFHKLLYLEELASQNPLYPYFSHYFLHRKLEFYILCIFSSVQPLSHVWIFVTPWTAAGQASLSTPNSQSLLKLMSTESVMPSNHLILCYPLLLLPSIFPSIRVFSNELVLCIRWPKYWSFSFSINPCTEYSVLISFRTDWLELLAVQRTLKRCLQHHISFFFSFFKIYFNWRLVTLQYCGGFCHTFTWISHGCTCVPHPDVQHHISKASILRCSAFCMVQFSICLFRTTCP